MMVSVCVIEVLLVDNRTCRKHSQKGFQSLMDILCFAFRKGEHFGQKQPVADGNVTVAVDDGFFRNGLYSSTSPKSMDLSVTSISVCRI